MRLGAASRRRCGNWEKLFVISFGKLKRQGHDDEAAADLERRFTNA